MSIIPGIDRMRDAGQVKCVELAELKHLRRELGLALDALELIAHRSNDLDLDVREVALEAINSFYDRGGKR